MHKLPRSTIAGNHEHRQARARKLRTELQINIEYLHHLRLILRTTTPDKTIDTLGKISIWAQGPFGPSSRACLGRGPIWYRVMSTIAFWHFEVPTPCGVLRAACCVLSTACCAVHAACCAVQAACNMLCTASCLWRGARCVLPAVWCMLCTACCL